MENKIKILHIISSLNYGGVETMLSRFILGTMNEFEHVVVTLNEKGQLSAELERNGIHIYDLRKKGKWDLAVIFKLRRIIKKEAPHIVQSYAFTGNIWSRLSLLFSKRKAYTYERGTAAVNNRFFNFIDRILSFKDEVRLCNSRTSKILTEKRVGIKKTAIIDNFIDLKTALGNRQKKFKGKFVIGYMGRLQWKRGAFLLPEIGALLKENMDDFVFLILGEGPLREMIENKIHEYQLEDHFIFKGFVKAPFEFMGNFDIGLFTNLTESFGNSALEMISRGVPIVAPYCDNFINIVKDGENGIMYDKLKSSRYRFFNVIDNKIVKGREGDPQIIVEKIIEMRKLLTEYRTKGANLKDHYMKFSEKNYIDALLEEYLKDEYK